MATPEYNYLKGLCKALAYMLKYHENQTRNDGSPYYSHPVKVAAHLASLNLFDNDLQLLDILLSVAILHDIIEDTEVTKGMLEKEFDKKVGHAVFLLTKINNVSIDNYYKQMYCDLITALVKIADRCNNVSTMAGVFTKNRLIKYIDETNTYVKPLIRYIRDNYPNVSNQVVAMGYHIKSVVTAIEVILPLMKDDENDNS